MATEERVMIEGKEYIKVPTIGCQRGEIPCAFGTAMTCGCWEYRNTHDISCKHAMFLAPLTYITLRLQSKI